MEYDFPLPVCPYANSEQLYPFQALSSTPWPRSWKTTFYKQITTPNQHRRPVEHTLAQVLKDDFLQTDHNPQSTPTPSRAHPGPGPERRLSTNRSQSPINTDAQSSTPWPRSWKTTFYKQITTSNQHRRPVEHTLAQVLDDDFLQTDHNPQSTLTPSRVLPGPGPGRRLSTNRSQPPINTDAQSSTPWPRSWKTTFYKQITTPNQHRHTVEHTLAQALEDDFLQTDHNPQSTPTPSRAHPGPGPGRRLSTNRSQPPINTDAQSSTPWPRSWKTTFYKQITTPNQH